MSLIKECTILNFLLKKYIITNGYKEQKENSDIDILLPHKDFKRIEKILKNYKTYNLVQIYHHDLYAKNCFLYNFDRNRLLNLDIYGRLERREVVFFKEEDIFNSLNYYKNIPILSPEKELIFYFIKKLDKNNFNNEVFNYLRKLYIKDIKKSKQVISNLLHNQSNSVIEAFEENNPYLINRDKILKEFDKNRKIDLLEKFLNICRIIKRIFYPTGLTVVFLGSDGSGKSTVIEKIKEKELAFRRVDYFHLKPLKSKNKNSIVAEPHRYPLYSKIKSFVKLFYFVYQYNFGWIKNIVPLKIRSSLVIFDRYYDDILVDNRRYRIGLSDKWIKLFGLFIPKPDLYFILTAGADVIYKRKQEVEFSELERQISAYRVLADGKKYFNINVDREPEEISREIIDIIMEKMSERY